MQKHKTSSKIFFATFVLFFLAFSLLGTSLYFIRENKAKVFADSQTNNVVDYEEYRSSNSENKSVDYVLENNESLIKSVEYYDNLFNGKTTQDILENYTLQLMQRKFIDAIGYDKIESEFLSGDDKQNRQQMLTWLFNDSTALIDFVTGGIPSGGNYINAL